MSAGGRLHLVAGLRPELVRPGGPVRADVAELACAHDPGGQVGDYISTSFLAGQQRVLNAFAVGFAPSGGALNEPMFSGLEKVRGGSKNTNPDPVLFAPDSAAAAADDEVATTAF